MLDMPSEVFREILSRVPAEPLLRFRSVSKSWRKTIDDPIFIRLHVDRQLLKIQHSSIDGVGHLILRGDFDTRFYSLSFESLHCDGDTTVKPSLLNHNPSCEGSPVGSCNGVMLISESKGNNLLWNPLTREFHRLPPLKGMSKKSRGLYHSVSGLGYVSATNDYKVVKIAQVFDPRDRSLKSETFVYSLKLDSWRRIKDFPFRISRLRGGIFLKGALHWISSTMPLKSMNDLIIGLDLETEDYCLLPLPTEISRLEKPPEAFSCYYQIERLDVWLMKDYGVKCSWIRLFSVSAQDNIGAVETLRPIAYLKCKEEVLLQHDKKEFVWFNLETKLGQKIRIDGRPTTFSSQFCLASLVRLRDIVVDGESNNAKRLARDKMNSAN
ncbi:hypothetical protein DH2020_010828 [Rehmannia glutinosa]|uniref:F-box domain-containing protein n=1 Tax=Rehmannia glutinosa TaxID=99300 RepID=A0ABR0XBP5_REHGL